MPQTTATLQSAQIGKKLVFLPKPYTPKTMTKLVGRQEEMKLITSAWMTGQSYLPLSPLLLGEPGVGKNRIVYELAERTGRLLYIFQGHEDVTAEDLACAVRFSDDGDRKMDYIASPLVAAMQTGNICFIDEIAKIRPRALALLVSVLDERRYIDSTLLGERVDAAEGFRFIAATNTADLDGNAMPEFLRSRMRPVINVGHPGRDEVDAIIKARHVRLQDFLDPLLDQFWSLWGASNGDHPPSPRDVIYAFDLAASIADHDHLGASVEKKLEVPSTAGVAGGAVMHKALEKAFQELFHRQKKSSS